MTGKVMAEINAACEPHGSPRLTRTLADAPEDEVGLLSRTLEALSRTLEQKTFALHESQVRLAQIANNLPVMISYLDQDGRFKFANSIYKEWIDVAPEDLIGRTLEEVYGSEIYAGFRHHIERGLGGERVVYERTMSGGRRVEGTLVPHIADDGRVQGLFVLIQDVTANRIALEMQARSEERLTLALEASGSALFDWDLRRNLVYLSAQAAALRGEPAAEETTTPEALERRLHPDDREQVKIRMMRAISGLAPHYEVECRIRARGDRWVWLRAVGRVVERDAQGQALRLAGTHFDITEKKAVEARLRALAEIDSLTGLPNRAVFADRLAQTLARPASAGQVVAVLFIDIDHFKAVNDNFGHAAGDQLLVDFARCLKAGVRDGDVVARLAGDEFTIILGGRASPAEVARVASTLIESTRRTLTVNSRAVAVSASIGIALLSPDESDSAEVMRRADAALYDAKRCGRNRFAFQSRPVVAALEFTPHPSAG